MILKDYAKWFKRRKELSFLSYMAKEFPEGKLRVLDVGCGDGFIIRVLRRRFPDWTFGGIDINPESIELAKKRGCLCTLGDAGKMPFKEKSFDLIYSVSFHCNPRTKMPAHNEEVFKEIRRVLKPSGKYMALGNEHRVSELVRNSKKSKMKICKTVHRNEKLAAVVFLR